MVFSKLNDSIILIDCYKYNFVLQLNKNSKALMLSYALDLPAYKGDQISVFYLVCTQRGWSVKESSAKLVEEGLSLPYGCCKSLKGSIPYCNNLLDVLFIYYCYCYCYSYCYCYCYYYLK